MKKIEHNITQLLLKAERRNPGKVALVFDQKSITFSELMNQVKMCANMLEDRGLKPGDRAILMIPMSVELYITLLAVMYCGATAVFVDPWMNLKQVAMFAKFAEPTAFIGIPKSHILRLFSKDLLTISLTISTGNSFCGIPAKFSLSSMKNYQSSREVTAVDLDDSALISFTSGSSGIPKGANRTHRFLLAQYNGLTAELTYSDNDVDMPIFPVFTLRNLAAGVTSVIPLIDFKNVANIDANLINRQIQQNQVNLITASPPFVDQLAQLKNPPKLAKIFTGGAPISNEQINDWHNKFPGCEIDIIYGSTEAEPVAHISSFERLKYANSVGFCCGKLTKLLNYKIVKICNHPITEELLEEMTLNNGEIGELIVVGEHVGTDYFRNPLAVKENKIVTREAIWHRMGDTGYFDENGYFFLTGRVHSTLVKNGQLIHAQLLESQVKKSVPSAKRVAAVQIDQEVVVVVQGKKESSIENKEIDRVIYTNKKLPLDPRHNSKVDYAILKSWLIKGVIK